VDNNIIKSFCNEKGLKILDTIIYDEELASTNAHGIAALDSSDKLKIIFDDMLDSIKLEVGI